MDITRTKRPDSWRREFIAKNGARCHYCNRPSSLDIGPGGRPWHIDHMNPIARGGEDSEENLALSCKRCNLVKGTRPYKKFKNLARDAFWQPDDGISEGEIDALMDMWGAAFGEGSAYRVSTLPAREAAHLREHLEREGVGRELLTFSSGGTVGEEMHHLTVASPYWGMSNSREQEMLNLLLAIHKLLPRLVAEVRLSRSETREEEA